MNSQRIQQLRSFLDETPEDPFLLFALALEYREEQPQKTLELFEGLLANHPDYLATYYHAASMIADTGNRDRAEALYRKGILLAQQQKDALALRELQNAFSQFQFEDEE